MTKRIDGMCGYNTVLGVCGHNAVPGAGGRYVVRTVAECAYHADRQAVPLTVRVTRAARMSEYSPRLAVGRVRR